ncbi:MAG: ATP-binding protein [Rubrivivax sp.]
MPLQHRGRALGVLNLFFDDNSAEPAGDVVALLKTIAELLGLALDNARLEEEKLRAELTAERHAIAADVHDSLGQSLAFVKMRLPLLHDAMQRGDREGAERYFEDVRETVGQAHAGLRVLLAHFLAPAEARGLASALAASAEAFRRASDTALVFDNELPQLELPPGQEVQVAHIVREALSNIARHAGARRAWLHVAQGDAPAGVRIVVQDDGAGLPAAEGAAAGDNGSHYGLAIMRERARRLGGQLSVAPREGGGTRVQLDFAAPATNHSSRAPLASTSAAGGAR